MIERQNFQGSRASSQFSCHLDIYGRCRKNQATLSAPPFSCSPFLCGCSSLMTVCCKTATQPDLFSSLVPFPDPCSFHLAEPSSQSPKSPCLQRPGVRCLSLASSWCLLLTLVFLIPGELVHSHAVRKPRAGLLIETADEWRTGFSMTLCY